MKTIKQRIAEQKSEEAKAALQELYNDLLEMAVKEAKYQANPLTPESGERSETCTMLTAEILGLETDDDWKPLKEAYEAAKAKVR